MELALNSLLNLISRFSNRAKETLRLASVRNFQDLGWFEILVCSGFYALLMALFPTEPPDDLLRHMKAYSYGYDYRLMWPYSPGVPGFNMYYLFDLFAGQIYSLLGPNSYVLIQILALTLYGVAIFWLLQGTSSRNWRFTLTMIILSLVFFRVFLARPTTFESGLFLLAVAACSDDRVKPWMHFLLGCLMACLYHAFFLYLLPLIIYRRVYALSLAAGLAGWVAFCGNGYFLALQGVIAIESLRGGIKVAESQPVLHAMMPVLFCLIPAFFYWRHEVRKLFATAWFLLSNRMRFIEVILPLLASYTKHWNVRLPQLSVALIVMSLCFFRPVTRAEDSWVSFRNVVPAGSRVLCLQSEPMYKLVYANSGLKLSPCMDAGWDTEALKAAIREADKSGALDPRVLKHARYDYLVESNLRKIPAGLQLAGLAGKYRVWKIPASMGPADEKTVGQRQEGGNHAS